MSLSYFQNAHHFEVNGGQFINVAPGATLTINNGDETDAVSTILHRYVATGATFDSAERYPPGKCHPGTRERILEEIMNWIDDVATSRYIVWLYGPAGSGKSALAQSICELLARTRPERNGASFFFANGLTDRGNAFKLFTTISYQLAIQFPCVRAQINTALTQDPILPTKSMEIQLQSLIVQPIKKCRIPRSQSPVIIIDGLDECADDEGATTQRNIVSLIAKSVTDHTLPVRFLVASRPEFWIRDAFDTPSSSPITLSLSLRHSFEVDEDIRKYLTDEFERIRLENKRVMGSVVVPWPSTEVLDCLVYEASGQFLYVSTVIKFVGKFSRFSDPQEQLRIITLPGPQRASAFSEVAKLYSRILSAYPRSETMKRVLEGLILYNGNLTYVKMFHGVAPGELVLVLDALSSLIDIRKVSSKDQMLNQLLRFTSSGQTFQDTVSFCHLSFLEFLKDDQRSGAFYIDVGDFRDEMTRALFGMIHRSLDQGYRSDRYLMLDIDFATYHWIMHKVAIESLCTSRIDTTRPLIICMTERLMLLVEFPFGRSMKSLVCFLEDMRVLKCAIEAELWTYAQGGMENPKKLTDFQIICKKFKDAVVLAQERATQALTIVLFGEFKVTPVVVYLVEFYRGTEWISPNCSALSSLTGGAKDSHVISTIKQNRHLMHLFYSHSTNSWRLRFMDLKAFFLAKGHATRLHIQDSEEWKDQQIFLFHHMLKLAFDENQFPTYPGNYQWYLILKKDLFDSRSMLDICVRKNRHRNASCKCSSLLRFIGDIRLELALRLKFWFWEDVDRHVPGFVTSMICWLNSQLTTPQTLELVRHHDEALPLKMTATMKFLFQEIFLQNFNKSYNKKFCVKPQGKTHWTYNYGDIRILTALPLPGGYDQIVTWDLFLDEDWYSNGLDWHSFHDEVFGNVESFTSPLIDPPSWYPRLAFRLLNAFVKFLYGEVNLGFSISNSWDKLARHKFQKSLSYLTRCLAFAEPTLENLEALRLIVYLYPYVVDVSTVTYFVPQGIWAAMAAFLQRYPRSLLSSEELDLFERWLSSPDHSDIRKYLSTSQPAPDLPSADTLAGNRPVKRHRDPTPVQNARTVTPPQDTRRKRARRNDDFT